MALVSKLKHSGCLYPVVLKSMDIKLRIEAIRRYYDAILLIALLVSRVIIYFAYGNLGVLAPDTTLRYIPQIETLRQSWLSFFSLTGPLYTLFLSLMDYFFGNVVVPTALIQHLLGIVAAFLVFRLLKRIHMDLAFVTVILVFCSPRAAIFEHLIIREAPMMLLLTCYISVLCAIVSIRPVEAPSLKPTSLFFLWGFLGVLCLLLRIEYLPVIVLAPMLLFFVLRGWPVVRKSFFILIYFLPIFAAFTMTQITKARFPPNQYSNCAFCIAYYSLQNDVFSYPPEESAHPSLVMAFQQIMSSCGKMDIACETRIIESAENYLREHPSLKSSGSRNILDDMYLEMMRKNTLVYLKSYGINFLRQLQGNQELPPSKNSQWWKDLLRILFPQVIINNVISVLFLCAVPLLLFDRTSRSPNAALILLFIVVTQLAVVSFVANPVARFRYPLDPYIYFFALQFLYGMRLSIAPLIFKRLK